MAEPNVVSNFWIPKVKHWVELLKYCIIELLR